jgi:polyketide biosynthesis acyl carrier protein
MTGTDLVRRAVHESIREVLPHLADTLLSDEDSLLELGADSVDRVEIMLGTLQRLGLGLPASDLAPLADLGELVDFLTKAVTT